MFLSSRSAHAVHLEPVRPAVLTVKPLLTVGEASSDATLALGRVGAVEEWDVLISDVTEPISGVMRVSLHVWLTEETPFTS